MGKTYPDWFRYQRSPDCDSCYEGPCELLPNWGTVESISNDPPANPVNNSVYIVGTVPTGDWVGHANEFAVYTALDNKWTFCTPYVSQIINIVDTPGVWYYWSSTAWLPGSGAVPATDFLFLSDTPASYAGFGGYQVAVNGTEDALEFIPQITPGGLVDTVTDSGAGDAGLIDTIASTPADIILRGIAGGFGIGISNTPNQIDVALSATGTADATTYLRGDNTWAVVPTPPHPSLQQVTDVGATTTNVMTTPGIDFTPGADPVHLEGRVFYDNVNKALAYYNDEAEVTMQLGQEEWIRVYNNSGALIENGKVVYISGTTAGFPEIDLARADVISTADVAGFTTHDIEDQTYGYVTRGGIIRDLDTSSYSTGDTIYLSDTVAGEYQSTPAHLPGVHVHLGHIIVVDAANGTVFFDLLYREADYAEIVRSNDGMSFEKADLTLVDNAPTNVLFEIEADGGGDVHYLIDGVYCTLDCTTGPGVGGKAQIALAYGAANDPTKYYIYATNSGAAVAILSISTSKPTGAFSWIATVSIGTETDFTNEGAFLFQRYTESFSNNNRGLFSHQREKLRAIGALYDSGGGHTITGTSPGTGPIHIDVSSAVVYQLHRQTFPAIATGPYYYGNSTAIYGSETDLTGFTNIEDGTAFANNDRYNLVVWGAVNYDGGSKLFVNLPDGAYNSDAQALADVDGTAITSVPTEMKQVAFLIARVVFKYTTAGGGTFEVLNSYSLLGQPVGVSGGGSGATASNEFVDSAFRIFDNIDPSKLLAFQVEELSAAVTRTITVPDHDYKIDPQIWIEAGAMLPDSDVSFGSGNVTAVVGEWNSSVAIDVMNFDPVGDGSAYFTIDVEQWMLDISSVRELDVEIYFEADATAVAFVFAVLTTVDNALIATGGTSYTTLTMTSGATTAGDLNSVSGEISATGSWAAPALNTPLLCALRLKSGSTTAVSDIKVLKVNIRPGAVI